MIELIAIDCLHVISIVGAWFNLCVGTVQQSSVIVTDCFLHTDCLQPCDYSYSMQSHGCKPEEVRPLCAFRVINILINVQIYMGAWAWNAKTMT